MKNLTPQFLRAKGASQYLGIATSTFWRYLSEDRLALTPVRLSKRCTLFSVAELNAILAQKVAKAQNERQV